MAIRMNALLMAAGDSAAYSGFFSAGWEYLSAQLDPLEMGVERGEILSDDLPVAQCMELLEQATRNYKVILLLAAPQPRTATLISALVAKGLGLELTVSPQAQQCVRAHAQRVTAPLSEQDELAFSTLPAGAVTLKNPNGYLQGYAISSRDQLLLVLPATPSELQNSYNAYVGELLSRFVERMETVPPAPRSNPPRIEPAPIQNAAIAPQGVGNREPVPAPKSQADTVTDVCRALEEAGLTVATAESGTNGAVSQILGGCDSPCYPPDAVFCGKEALDSLDIPPQLLQSSGAVSSRAAAALALAARSRAGTNLGAAVTAGKNGTAFLAMTDGKRVWNKTVQGQNPHQLKLSAVLTLLGILNMYAAGQGLPQGTPAADIMSGTRSGGIARTGGITGGIQGMMNQIRPTGRRTPKEGSESSTMARTNLIQRLRYGNSTRNDKIRLGAVGMFLCIFIGCMVYIGSVYKESADNITLSDGLRQLANTSEVPDKIKGKYPKDYNVRFAGLYAENDDVAGWITIPGTKVDYVTVQTTDNAFYERKDFTRATNQHGVPFVDFRVDQKEPSDNIVIYAHNMDDGQMFGELLNYKSLAYYQQHPLVEYDSVYQDGTYKIFGIVICRKDDPDFNYHNNIDMDDGEMTDFVTGIRERSLINTNVDVRTDDQLLTLSTCDYSFKGTNGEHLARFVVFARKVRPGEDSHVDVSKAAVNPSPVMAKEWYDKLAKQQVEAEKKAEASASSASASTATSGNKKWLTADEIATLSPEDQKDLADRREARAKKYLTSDEIATLSLDDRLYLMDQREDLFGLFLTSDEQNQSISKRIRLADERQEYARQWLTDEEIRAAGKWSRIEALIAERQNGQGTATEKKWLTEEEIKTLSPSERSALIAERQKMAKDAGLTAAEINAAKSWAEIQNLIADKQAGSADAAIKAYIKENPKWLESSDGNGRTLEELKALVSERKGMAAAAGIDINKYKTWPEMRKAIDAANAASGTAAANKLIADNPKWLDQGDRGKSVAELQRLMTERKAMAAAAGIDPNKYKTWAEILKAIQAAPPPGITSIPKP